MRNGMNLDGASPRLWCPVCGAETDLGIRYACDCSAQANLAVRHRLDDDVSQAWRTACGQDDDRTLWRYQPLLPVSRRFASRLQVGGTPLLDGGETHGVRLRLKDETRNPSGSLKDRASEVALAVGCAFGRFDVIAASTGNAAASLACVGAAMGVRVTLVVPQDAPVAKLAQMVAYGARVLRVAGDYDAAFEVSRSVTATHGIYNRNTGFNPFTREGKKTCAFEIAEQCHWRAPNWVIVPTGDGNILSAMHQGFSELRALGVIARTPRLVAAQSEASAGICQLFHGRRPREAPAHTIADSISVRRPRDADAAVRALQASDGLAVEISDRGILAAVEALATTHGCFVEPSAAAAYAAWLELLERGAFEPGDTVVCLLTGSGLKDIRAALAGLEQRLPKVVAPAECARVIAEVYASGPPARRQATAAGSEG